MPRRASDSTDRQGRLAEESMTPSSTRRWPQALVIALGMLVVFMVHFRPWEVAYMEEWPLAADWSSGGGAFTADYLSWTLSRPLHLIPTMLGLAIAGGAPGGIFLILALVAAAQLPVVIWALRPLSRSAWISGAIGLFLSLHPLWAGGFLQRFLPAQTAALALAVAAGMLVRWFVRGRILWLVSACLVLLTGYLAYPAPTVVAPLLAAVVALVVTTSWRNRIVGVAAVTATSAAMTLYSLVVARLLSPSGSSYELGNIEQAAVSGPREFTALVSGTLLNHGETILLAACGIAALGALLALSGVLPHSAGWVMAGAAILTPMTTIVYFGHTGWLQDIDRLAYVCSLTLFAALLPWGLRGSRVHAALQNTVAVTAVILSMVGAISGVQHWQSDIELQHRLLNELSPFVEQADGDEIIVVVDRSGTYGRMETFPLQYLSSASAVWNEDTTMVWLCFDPADVPSGGAACDPADTGDNTRPLRTVPMPNGSVEILLGHKESDD